MCHLINKPHVWLWQLKFWEIIYTGVHKWSETLSGSFSMRFIILTMRKEVWFGRKLLSCYHNTLELSCSVLLYQITWNLQTGSEEQREEWSMLWRLSIDLYHLNTHCLSLTSSIPLNRRMEDFWRKSTIISNIKSTCVREIRKMSKRPWSKKRKRKSRKEVSTTIIVDSKRSS